jgi:cytochrome c-type biogenesis protein CcmH
MRTGIAGAAVVVAVLVGVASAWMVAGDVNRPMSARVGDVASGLRCPTCSAVSVSASNSPMAQSMRAQIRRQLSAGRSPEQIRAWFADRYGGQVLLDPEPEGLGLVLWVLPAAALAGGVVAFVMTRRRPGLPVGGTDGVARPAISGRRVAVAGLVVLAVGAVVPVALWDAGSGEAAASATAPASSGQPEMSAPDWVSVATSLERQEAYGAAAEAYRKALQGRPGSPAVRTRLAFVLVRDGNPEEALPLVRRLANRAGPHRVEALLVLGLAQRAASLPRSAGTLRQFLALAPDHPAGGQIRRLLRDDG